MACLVTYLRLVGLSRWSSYSTLLACLLRLVPCTDGSKSFIIRGYTLRCARLELAQGLGGDTVRHDVVYIMTVGSANTVPVSLPGS